MISFFQPQEKVKNWGNRILLVYFIDTYGFHLLWFMVYLSPSRNLCSMNVILGRVPPHCMVPIPLVLIFRSSKNLQLLS